MKTTNEKTDARGRTKIRKGGYKSTKGHGNSPTKGLREGKKSGEKKTHRVVGLPNIQDTPTERKETPTGKRETPSRWEPFETKLKEKQKAPEKIQNIVMQMIPPQKAEPAFDLKSMKPVAELKLPSLKRSSGGDMRRGSDSSIGGSTGRRSSDSRMFHDNPETFSIFNDIAQKRKTRLEKEIREKLNEINGRVQHALQNSGFEEDELNIEKKTAADDLHIKAIAARSKREKVDERKNVISIIHEYVGDCKERYGVIDQVNNWIHIQQEELEKELKPDEEYASAIKSADASYGDITDSLYVYTDTTERLKTLSQILLRNIRQMIEKKEKHVAPKIIVLDDHSMLASIVKWDTAVSAISNLLDEAVKWVKTIPLILALKNGKKQYVYLLKAIDKKLADLASSQKTVEDLRNKVALGNTRVDECLKEQSDLRRSVMNLQTNLDDVNNQLKMALEKNERLLGKIGKLEVLINDLKEELAKPLPPPPPPPEPEIVYLQPQTPPKPPTPPPPPPPPPPKPTISEEVEEEIRLMEQQIKDYQIMLKELQDRIMMLENNVVKEQNRVKLLKTALEEANRQLHIAQMNAAQPAGPPDAPAPTPEIKIEFKVDIPDLIGHHSPDVQNFKISEASANYYKTLLSGMKQDFVHEMERLKDHVKKENTRHDATVRRIEHTHRDQIQSIQKNVLRLLRALRNFRDQLAIALAREGYAESASQLEALPNPMPKNLKVEPRELLSRLARNVVEYLHKIENIMIHTLMSIRILNKSMAASQKEGMMKEIAERVKNINNAKELSKETAVRLKTNKAKLETKQEDFIASHNNAKYTSLLKRYKLIWKMYMKMMSEMDVLEYDFERTLEENLGEEDPLLISQIRMEIKKAKLNKKDKFVKVKRNVPEENRVGKKGTTAKEGNVPKEGIVEKKGTTTKGGNVPKEGIVEKKGTTTKEGNVSKEGIVEEKRTTGKGGNASKEKAVNGGKAFIPGIPNTERKMAEGLATKEAKVAKERRAFEEKSIKSMRTNANQRTTSKSPSVKLPSIDKSFRSLGDGDQDEDEFEDKFEDEFEDEFEDGDDILDFNCEDGDGIYDDDIEDEDDFSEGMMTFNISNAFTEKEMHKSVHENVTQPKIEFSSLRKMTTEEKQIIPESQTNRKSEGHTITKFFMKGKAIERNMNVLDNAYKKKLISSDLYQKAKGSIAARKKSIAQLFQNLVYQYVAFKALQEAEEKSKKLMGGDVYLPTSKRPALQNLLKRINKRLAGDFIKAKRESENAEEKITESGRKMINMCNEVLMATGVELVKPNAIVVEKPGTTPHLPPVTHPASRKMQTLIKQRQKKEHLKKYRCRLPPLLVGNNINVTSKINKTSPISVTSKMNKASWNNEYPKTHLLKDNITTPLLVSLDVNNSIIKAKRSLLRRKSGECQVSKTRSYHLTSDLRLKFINEII